MKKLSEWFGNNKDSLIRNSFLIPILLVVAMSISHVVSWYDIGNPLTWAIYLSVAIEIFALASVAASTVKMSKGSIWFLFGLVTFIQITGNVFFTYKEISTVGGDFPIWVEMIQPLFDDWNLTDHRRLLALFQGGTLPLMSLISLHFYIQYSDNKYDETAIVEEVVLEEEREATTPTFPNEEGIFAIKEEDKEDLTMKLHVSPSKDKKSIEFTEEIKEPYPHAPVQSLNEIANDETRNETTGDIPDAMITPLIVDTKVPQLEDISLGNDDSLDSALTEYEESKAEDLRHAINYWGQMKGTYDNVPEEDILKFYTDSIETTKSKPKTVLNKTINTVTGKYTETLVKK